MSARESLKKYIEQKGEGWHGVTGDRPMQRRFSEIKTRLLQGKISEEKAEETILLIGGRKISEPVYEIGGKEY
jgi:hypothetical protein